MPLRCLGQEKGPNKIPAFLDRLEASLEATSDSLDLFKA